MSYEPLLKRFGLRKTRSRESILRVLFDACQPLSSDEITGLLDATEADRVTVYRTLQRLEQCGLVHTIKGIDGVQRYRIHGLDPEGCPGNHPHFLCRGCGNMWCMEDQRLQWVDVPEGYRVEGKQLLVLGLCPDCAGGED